MVGNPNLKNQALLDDAAVKNQGVFEETAALKNNEPQSAQDVVSLLMLLKQNQTRPALKLLNELAQKGEATGALMYLFRIFPLVKGEEKLLADMVLLNLSRLKDFINPVQGEYVAELYLLGARAFYDAGAYAEAVRILRDKKFSLLMNGDERLVQKYSNLMKLLDSKGQHIENNVKNYETVSGVKQEVKQIFTPENKVIAKEDSVEVLKETDDEEEAAAVDILKITTEEVERHFETIKRLSKEAVARAEAQAKLHAGRVSKGAQKFKKLAKKIKFFKKSGDEIN